MPGWSYFDVQELPQPVYERLLVKLAERQKREQQEQDT